MDRPIKHPALQPGRVAVITGGASGIGLAVAEKLAASGMRVCLADLDGPALMAATETVRTAADAPGDVIAVATDVRDPAQVTRLKDTVYAAFGEVAFLMNNAGTEGGGQLSGDAAQWRRILDTNLWGVINGVQTFVPAMQAQGTDCLIVNTGSKQGITCPPGDTAYNVSKAGVKVVTEALEHDLRAAPGRRITAHLLIPGFTFTGLTRVHTPTRPDAAWTAEQVADFMLDGIGAGDFYILCPDNAVSRATDQLRIAWAAGDIIENRPPLSRWHPDHAGAFARYLEDGLKRRG